MKIYLAEGGSLFRMISKGGVGYEIIIVPLTAYITRKVFEKEASAA